MVDVSMLDEVFEDEPVSIAYLFGSHVRGDEHEGSDVDIGVVLTSEVSSPLRYVVRLTRRLEDLIGDNVDIVVLTDVEPRFAHQVITSGEVIYCDDQDRRASFETQVSKHYHDVKRYNDRYFDSVRESFKS